MAIELSVMAIEQMRLSTYGEQTKHSVTERVRDVLMPRTIETKEL
jgi:hypothetical protein